MRGSKKTKGRSTITNGTRLIPKTKGANIVDGRSSHMRRFRDVFAMHIADLGGHDAISEAERSIARRAATLTVILERLEFDFASDDQSSPSASKITQYQQLANTLKRLLESLGLKRRSKDITPSLSDYLKSKTIDHDDDLPRHARNGSTQRVRQ